MNLKITSIKILYFVWEKHPAICKTDEAIKLFNSLKIDGENLVDILTHLSEIGYIKVIYGSLVQQTEKTNSYLGDNLTSIELGVNGMEYVTKRQNEKWKWINLFGGFILGIISTLLCTYLVNLCKSQ